jgi:peptide/nickel transport system permease protein
MSAGETLGAVRVRRFAQASRGNPLLTLACVLLALLVLGGILAPWLAPVPADAGSASHPLATLAPPSAAHPFGTDQIGRDILSRVLYGLRVTPLIGLAVIVISGMVGVPLGLCAGYFGGFVDELIMRVTDVFLAVPALLLALTFTVILPPSIASVTVAIAITWWPWYVRLVRGEVVSVIQRRYVENARVLGLPRWRVVLRHVLPNAVTPVLVQASLDVGGVILTAAALSYLGLGAQDPTPDWGLMISQGQSYFTTQWWLVVFPGLAVLLTALTFNLLGDGIQDQLNPRRKRAA